MRIDVYMTEKGLAESRSRAQAMISEGFVLLNGKTVKKPSLAVADGDTVTVYSQTAPFLVDKAVEIVADFPIEYYSRTHVAAVNGGVYTFSTASSSDMTYVDWYVDKQPTREQALEKLLGRVHNGAVVLLHSTSATNAAVLEEVILKWKEMGYTFGTLAELQGG